MLQYCVLMFGILCHKTDVCVCNRTKEIIKSPLLALINKGFSYSSYDIEC